MTTTVLITGANRGIGHGLLTRFLNTPNHTVIAAVRNPDDATVKDLSKLPKAAGSKLVVIKIDASIWEDAAKAIATLSASGIDTIDIVIANAGITKVFPTVPEVKQKDLQEHIETNVYSVVSLYQAVRPLLQKSKRQGGPVFTVMGSGFGSLGFQFPMPCGVYGASKVAAHWYAVKINTEEDWLDSFVLSPRAVFTDMGRESSKILGLSDEAIAGFMVPLEEVASNICGILARTTKAEHGGKFVEDTGKILPW